MKKLVIVESPSKAKTINKYLGNDYVVKASKGHVVDLPKSKMGIDVEDGFKPHYEVTKKKALSDLKKAYKEADELILAVDLDREGEAIGWHVAQKLGAMTPTGKEKKGHSVKRIVFSEITKSAIQDAIKKPREVNMDLVNAQQARRFLDRLVGYSLSPVLWKKIAFGLSAGRVQSVALRLIVEKEEERDAFVPEEYWSLLAFAAMDAASSVDVHFYEKDDDAEKKKEIIEQYADQVTFDLAKVDGKKVNVHDRKAMDSVLSRVNTKPHTLTVQSIDTKVTRRHPKPPFTTSTMQQTAINMLGFSSKRTMMVAQKLYEAGHITYMRTDSVAMSQQAIDQVRSVIQKKYGKKYVPGKARVYKTKSKSSQEAHECIRPVDLSKAAIDSLTAEQKSLYSLIWKRAVASQMNSAELEQVSVQAHPNDTQVIFKARGNRVLFAGFMATGIESSKEQLLPEFSEGDTLHMHGLLASQHFTQPPARYSEASIVKKLEELGIGRPSTYSSIISVIISRKYVEKDGRYLFPTDTGKVVTKLLTKYFPDVVDYNFTSEMEDDLDAIAEGKVDWKKMLREFYNPFAKQIEDKTQSIPREEFTVLGDAPDDIVCPECGSKMQKKLGRYGVFYSCSRWPDCKGMRSIDGESAEEVENEVHSDEFKETYEPAPKTEEGKDYILKKGRYGKFWAHPDYPKVKDAQPLVYTKKKQLVLFGEAPKTEEGKEYILRSGKYGYFWAHPEYPKVKDIKKIKKSSNSS